jgi:radical SAM superfamily enzyme YgiQ (UPF0313 family)
MQMVRLPGHPKSVRKIAILEPATSTTNVYGGMQVPGVGSVLLGTILARRGHEVAVYIEEIAPFDWADIMGADLVGISSITPAAPRSYAIADVIRWAGIPVVMGGYHPTFLPDEALEHADFVVRGEGEDTLVELARDIEAGGDFSAIAGLSFNAGGEAVHNADRPLERDLDRFPIPDFSLVHGMRPGRAVSIITRRGCPFGCSFCSVAPFSGNSVREHSVERVLEEIEQQMHWVGKHGGLFFGDDIFNLRPERMKRILGGMIANGMRPTWAGQVRHEAARDPELLELMRESNCARLLVGFESINPRSLERFDKREKVEDIARAIRAFHDARIKVHGMFVLGSDEDTLETIEETLAFAQAHDLDSMQINCLTPLPGSRDFNDISSRPDALLRAPWSYFDGNHVVHVPRRITPALLQTSVSNVMRRFYSAGAVARRLFRGDLSEAAVRLHGYRLVRRFARQSRPYFRWLTNPRGAAPPAHGDISLKPVDMARVALRQCFHFSLRERLGFWFRKHFALSFTRFINLPSAFAKRDTAPPPRPKPPKRRLRRREPSSASVEVRH